MLEIIKCRTYSEAVHHRRVFDFADEPGRGYWFESDDRGQVKEDDLTPEARANLHRCMTGQYDVVDQGVRTWRTQYTDPAVGRCVCGREVELFGFTNTCECGIDYNMSGQALAPREQWGEETGESLAEILSIA